MSSGKYLSLDEARKTDQLDRFCEEHPSTGDMDLFDRAFNAMAAGPKSLEASEATKRGDDDASYA